MYTSNNYLNYNTNEFSSDLPSQSSFHNVNQQFIGNNSMKNDFDVSSLENLSIFVIVYWILESNELFCSSSTSYPPSTATFAIPAHASGRNRKIILLDKSFLF